MVPVFAIRHIHDEECRNQLRTRSRTQNLQSRTQGVCGGMAGTGNESVCFIVLEHDHTESRMVAKQRLLCLFRGHSLSLAQLIEQIHILIELCAVLRIDDSRTGDINAIRCCICLDLLFISDEDQLCGSFSENLCSSSERTLVFRFRKDDRLDILSCLFLDSFNE